MSKPICFKIRGGVEREDGSRGSKNIGKTAGKGYLGAEDKAFTIGVAQDQYLFASEGEGNYAYPFDQKPTHTGKMKYLSLFSGIDAASVAWNPLGWEAVGFSEIEPFPCELLKQRYPNVPNYGDITKWKDWGLVPGSVDLVSAGSPCQAFSYAGLRKGLDDPRGNLALVTLALVEHLKPKWFIWENVPGVLTSDGGRDFSTFLTALGDIGYGWAYRVLDANYFNLAQRRRRVWLVAHSSGDWQSAAGTLFDEQSLCWNPASSGRKRPTTSSTSTECLDEGGLQRSVGSICADSHPGSYTGQDAYSGRLISDYENFKVRRLSVKECERLFGFPDDYTKINWRGKSLDECPQGSRYKAIGNSWAVPCARWIGERINLVESIKNEQAIA
jgi:DNA (cytosine-5)-methyltransferase 1